MLNRTTIQFLFGILAIAAIGTGFYVLNKQQMADHKKVYTPQGIIPELSSEPVKKVVFKNGMTLLMYKTDLQPKVLVKMAYDIGSYVERAGERGLAHLIEHMIFKGTTTLSESDIPALAKKYGAASNATTSLDSTDYWFETDKNNWKPFVNIFADCMQNARFDEQHLASEMPTVIQELRMNLDNPERLLMSKMAAICFPPNHPYNCLPIGYKEDLVHITAAQAKEFYNKYYHPSHATLFVVGDIDYNDVTAYVKSQCENIANQHEVIVPPFPYIPPLLSATHETMYGNVKKPKTVFFWRLPAQDYALAVPSGATSALLAGSMTSPITKELVRTRAIATSAGASVLNLKDGSIFLIGIDPIDGAQEQCRDAVVKLLAHAAHNGFSPAKMSALKRTTSMEACTLLQHLNAFSSIWMELTLRTGNEYALFENLKKSLALTSADLQQFIAQYLRPETMQQIDLLPMPESLAAESSAAQKADDALERSILDAHKRTTPVEPVRYALSAPAPQPLEYSIPKPDRVFTLPNGLTVLMCKRTTLPLISIEAIFKEETYLLRSRDGIAVEWMMGGLSMGSTGATLDDHQAFFEGYATGCDLSAHGASATMLSSDFEDVLKRLMLILQSPTFPEKECNLIRSQLISDLNQQLSNPSAVANSFIGKALFGPQHPYGSTLEDQIALLKTTSIATLHDWHKKLVAPNNMLFSFVGDFDLDKAQASINAICGTWPAGNEFRAPQPLPEPQKTDVLDQALDTTQTALVLCKQGKVVFQDEDFGTLQLLDKVAFASLGSRIFQLRSDRGLFYHADGSWQSKASNVDGGIAYTSTVVNPDRVAEAESGLLEILKIMQKDGITEPELEAARHLTLTSYIGVSSTYRSLASAQLRLQRYGLGFDFYDKRMAFIRSLTLEQVNKACAQHCSLEGASRIRAGRL